MSNNYLVMNEKIAYEHIKNTAANHTINGFYYQFLVTVSKWLDLYNEYKDKNESYRLYCEFEDDIRIEEDNAIKYVQVKANKSPLTKGGDSLKKTIYNFFLLYYYNKKIDKEIKFVLESNGDIGKNSDLLKKWSSQNLSKEDRIKVIDLLKKIIVQKLEKINKILPPDVNFNDFMDLINFDLKGQSVDECNYKEKNNILEKIRNSHIDIDGKILLPRLLQEVIDKSSNKDESNRILDSKCLKAILNEGEDIISNRTEEKYKDMLKNIDDKLKFIDENTKETNGNVKCIKNIVEILKNDVKAIINLNESNLIYMDLKEKKEYIKVNSTKILIRSKVKKIENCNNMLSLSSFFVKEEECYKKIIKDEYWNKEIVKEIDNFFVNFRDSNISEHILIDLASTHTSIAFYIGYKHSKKFCRHIYPIESGEIYFRRECVKSNNEWHVEHIEKNKGKDIAVFINVITKNNNGAVNKFIDDSNLKVGELLNINLSECSQSSITEDNGWMLADTLCEYLNKYKTALHIFFMGPNKLAFLIGSMLNKNSNITLYEYVNYQSEGTELGRNLYTQAIKTKI